MFLFREKNTKHPSYIFRRFGYLSTISCYKLSSGAKIGIFIYGFPFIGSFIRSLYFKEYVKKLKVRDVLDAGCGFGDYAFYLAHRYPDMVIDAMDVKDIELCKEVQEKYNFRNINFLNCNISCLEIENKYDLIYSIELLEHIECKEEAIKKFYRALKNGGFLLIHIPQKDWHQVHIFSPKRFKKFNEFEKVEHIGKQFDMEEFITILLRHNFKVIDKRKTFGIFGKLAWELDQICQENNYGYLKSVLLPFLKLLGFIDTKINNTNGTGILVLAQR